MALTLLAIEHAVVTECCPGNPNDDLPDGVWFDGDSYVQGVRAASAVMSFTEFDRLRQALAVLAGVKWDNSPIPTGVPFGMLLDHCDCSGLIMPADAKSIAADFNKHRLAVKCDASVRADYDLLNEFFHEASQHNALVIFAP